MKSQCSCCSVQVNPFNEWFRHPVLETIQCQKCNEFYIDGEFTKDKDGYYEHWDGGYFMSFWLLETLTDA